MTRQGAKQRERTLISRLARLIDYCFTVGAAAAFFLGRRVIVSPESPLLSQPRTIQDNWAAHHHHLQINAQSRGDLLANELGTRVTE